MVDCQCHGLYADFNGPSADHLQATPTDAGRALHPGPLAPGGLLLSGTVTKVVLEKGPLNHEPAFRSTILYACIFPLLGQKQ